MPPMVLVLTLRTTGELAHDGQHCAYGTETLARPGLNADHPDTDADLHPDTQTIEMALKGQRDRPRHWY